MGLGRKGDLVAKTPTLVFPPSLGGRTVASILNGLTEDGITVELLGGNLEIFWDRKENVVYMTGPATTIFEGEIEI